MSRDEENLMAKHGITSELKTFYYYKQNRYDNLSDAIYYAELDSNRVRVDPLNTTH